MQIKMKLLDKLGEIDRLYEIATTRFVCNTDMNRKMTRKI